MHEFNKYSCKANLLLVYETLAPVSDVAAEEQEALLLFEDDDDDVIVEEGRAYKRSCSVDGRQYWLNKQQQARSGNASTHCHFHSTVPHLGSMYMYRYMYVRVYTVPKPEFKFHFPTKCGHLIKVELRSSLNLKRSVLY